MLIDWLINIVYFGLLLSWVSATWAVSVLEVGVLLIAGVLVIRQIMEKRSFRLSPDGAALAIIILVGPLQVAFGLTVSTYLTWNATLYWLGLASVYLAAKTLLASRSARSRFLTHQVWAGSVLSVISVFLFFVTPQKIYWTFTSRYAAFGPFIYKNHFAAFIELLLPIAIYKMVFDTRHRLLYAGLFAALLACMVGSLSRAGVIIAVAETIVMLALAYARGALPGRTLRNLGVPIVILVFLFTLMVGWEGIWKRFQEQRSFAMRNELAISTLEMVKSKPLAGFGLGTWRTVYPQFATFDIARVANEAHDDWLQWTSEGGVGFALVILFFAVYVSRFAWEQIWGLGVPAVFIHCLIDYPTRNTALAAFLFLFAGALAAVSDGKREKAERSDPEWRVLSVRTSGAS